MFQTLFRAADHEVGLDRPLDLFQHDTSEFDRLAESGDQEDQGGGSSASQQRKFVIPEEPGIISLRCAIRHVPPSSGPNVHASSMTEFMNDGNGMSMPIGNGLRAVNGTDLRKMVNEAGKQGYLLPEIDWQSEVYSVLGEGLGITYNAYNDVHGCATGFLRHGDMEEEEEEEEQPVKGKGKTKKPIPSSSSRSSSSSSHALHPKLPPGTVIPSITPLL